MRPGHLRIKGVICAYTRTVHAYLVCSVGLFDFRVDPESQLLGLLQIFLERDKGVLPVVERVAVITGLEGREK